MKKFLAVFTAPLEAYDKMKAEMQSKTPEERQAEMDAWTKWMESHKDAILDSGGGVGSAKRVSEDGTVSDARNEIGGYMVVQAESADAAAALFKDSPHFGVAGGSIDIMEIMFM